MPSATEFMNNSTADAVIEEIWSKVALVTREQKLALASRLDRRLEKEMDHGDIIHALNVGNLTVQTKSTRTAISYEAPTPTNSDLTVDTWNYHGLAIETKTKKQAARDLMMIYAPKQSYALTQAIDDVLAGRVDDLSTYVLGTLGTPTSYDDWLQAMQYLDDANVPMDDRFIYIAPIEKKNLYSMPQFIHGDYSKLQGELKRDREVIGTWLGVPVVCSTNVDGTNAAGHDNALCHREAFQLVIQINMPTYKMFDMDYFAHKVALESLFGSATMRGDHCVWVKGA